MLLVLKYSFSNVKSFIYIMYTSPRMVHPLPTHRGDGSVVLLKSRQWAGDTSIFSVVTVVHCPGYMGAIVKGGLHAGALEIVQQDCSCARPEESVPPSRRGFPAAQLATHNLRVRDVPSIIAHCAPFRIWVHLNPTLTLVLAAHQSHHSYKNIEESHLSRVQRKWVDIVLVENTFNRPSEGGVVVVGILAVTPKSRPLTLRPWKAKETEESRVMLVGHVHTQEISGDKSNNEALL